MRTLLTSIRAIFIALLILLLGLEVQAQPTASDLNSGHLAHALLQVEAAHGGLVRISIPVRSLEGRPVWLVEIGAGPEVERRQRPAMLVTAGIEGHDLMGSAVALRWIEDLAAQYRHDDSIRQILDTTTIYVFPRVNPDAADSFFARPKAEYSVNRRPFDDDHDGLVDEDSPDDLNGDGLITSMRVADAEGEFMVDPVDPRLLMRADPAKEEEARWRLLSEGQDADGDERWNEDGVGGVHFNRNFPFQYEYFQPTSGLYPVSEPITRMLAEFVVEHPNIGLAFTFGGADNLAGTPKGAPPAESRKPQTAIQNDDLPYYRHLGQEWRDMLGLDKELEVQTRPGSFSDWIYFHRGRFSLAAEPWSPSLQLAMGKKEPEADEGDVRKDAPELSTGSGRSEDSPNAGGARDRDQQTPDQTPASPRSEAVDDGKAAPADEPKKKPKDKGDKRNQEERAFLKWIDEHAPEKFVPWKRIEHPDFPGQTVEVGGFAPFAKTHPPEKILTELAEKQSQFLTRLAGMLPRIQIGQVEIEHLGESVFEISVQITNTGYLPTSLAHGKTSREVLPTRVILHCDESAFLGGTRMTFVDAVGGSGGVREVRYIIHAGGRSTAELEVISALGGRVQTTLRLDPSSSPRTP